MTLPAFAVDALATWRLTRLVTEDTITEPLRAAVGRRSKWLGYLVSCPHCTGVYVGLGVVAARRLAPQLWAPLADALALAAVTSITADYT